LWGVVTIKTETGYNEAPHFEQKLAPSGTIFPHRAIHVFQLQIKNLYQVFKAFHKILRKLEKSFSVYIQNRVVTTDGRLK
jgi:hypothetical protein